MHVDFFLSPPNNGLLSDEDSNDEKGMSADHPSGLQLSTAAEYHNDCGTSVVDSLECDLSKDEMSLGASDDTVLSSISDLENSLLLLKPAKSSISLKRNDLTSITFLNLHSKKSLENVFSPTAIFDLVFDEKIITYLTEMTNLCAYRDKGKHTFYVVHSEIRLFLAMLLLPSCMY